jgi:hypothetical protein
MTNRQVKTIIIYLINLGLIALGLYFSEIALGLNFWNLLLLFLSIFCVGFGAWGVFLKIVDDIKRKQSRNLTQRLLNDLRKGE